MAKAKAKAKQATPEPAKKAPVLPFPAQTDAKTPAQPYPWWME